MPSKLQAIMAMGQPVLVAAPGDAARVVTEAGAGFAVPPGCPSALAQAMSSASQLPRHVLRQMGHEGRRRYLAEMSADVGTRALDRILRAAAASAGRTSWAADVAVSMPTGGRE
jgi:glycosyltransferase involved in cell wall biosynthesis